MKRSTQYNNNKRKREIIEMFDNFDITIKEKLVKDITESYGQILKEIDRRSLARKNSLEYPRLDHFLKSVFFYLFEKLHRGDKNKSNKLIRELKTQASINNYQRDNIGVSDFIRDDISYAQAEFEAIFVQNDLVLKNELKDLILYTYDKTILEVKIKNLVQRSGYPQPCLERYIKSVFSYVFEKLHKGDKLKALEIMNDELEKLKEVE